MTTTGALSAGTTTTARSRTGTRLTPARRKILLTGHIASSVAVLGADFALLTLGISGWGGSDPRTVYPAMSLISTWAIAPLAVLALGSGLILGALTRYGLLRYWWVTIKLAITAVLTALVLFVVVPGLASTADTATALPPGALLADAQRLAYAITPTVTLALLLLNVALSVSKPRWRLRGTTRGTA